MNSPHIRRLRHQLASGKPASASDDSLPDRSQLEASVQRFLRSADRASGIPEKLRREVTSVLDSLYGSGTVIGTAAPEFASEAVVIADGSRPVFYIDGDELVEPEIIGDGPFVDVARTNRLRIEDTALAVGRIENDIKSPPPGVDKWYEGTAFLISANLAVTNRHVIERMVTDPSSQFGPFMLKSRYWLNFDAQSSSTGNRRFSIDRVVYAGPEVIGEGGDISRLDLALLEIGSSEKPGTTTPEPRALTSAPLSVFDKVAIIGFPAPPRIFSGTGTPPANHELEEVLRTIFDKRFGYKRCATGEVDQAAGTNSRDSKGWTVTHDASTLTGNSGSPLIGLETGSRAVAALHFGGASRVENYAHQFSMLHDELREFGVSIQD